ADHEDGGERHGQGGDQRRDLAENGDRQRHGIVEDREGEILPDQPAGLAGHGDGGRHRLQPLAQEDEIGGIAADIGGGGGGHGDMGGGKGGGVVEPVADHQHRAALAGHAFERGELVGRQKAG